MTTIAKTLVMLCILGPALTAQTPARLSGRILDARTGRPIRGAAVELIGAVQIVVRSSASRTYVLTVRTGEYRLRVEAPDYQPQQINTACMTSGAASNLDFRLTPLREIWGNTPATYPTGNQGIVLRMYGPDLSRAAVTVLRNPALECAAHRKTTAGLAVRRRKARLSSGSRTHHLPRDLRKCMRCPNDAAEAIHMRKSVPRVDYPKPRRALKNSGRRRSPSWRIVGIRRQFCCASCRSI